MDSSKLASLIFLDARLVGQRPMKPLLSICPSVCSSVKSFLKIGSLVFSDILYDAS